MGGLLKTALGRTLAVWMAASVLLVLGVGPLGEALPDAPVLFIVNLAVLLPFPVLAVWSAIAAIRTPRRHWPAPVSLAVFCVAFVLGFETLGSFGARLYFAHREAPYEKIIAEARAGRLPLDGDGRAIGRRYGASYLVQPGERPLAQFAWGDVDGGFFGVMYDAQECGLTPPPPPPPPPTDPDAPTMKNAGRLGGPHWPLSDEACLLYFIW